MFDFVRRHTRLMQIALVLLIFPSFVVFGIQGYQRFAEGNDAVAEVAGAMISRQAWDNAHRQQVERLRAQMPGVDVRMLDTPAVKQRVLEDLIRERVLFEAARKLMLAPSDAQLLRAFQTDPQYSALRNADGSVRRELLQAQGISSEQFAVQLKQDMAMRQVMHGIAVSNPAAGRPTSLALDAMFQQRHVRIARFDTKNFLSRVAVSDQDIQAYYDDPAHAAALQAAEHVSVEYVVLDVASIKNGIEVSEDDLRKYYAENLARYTQPAEVRARHILVQADKGAPAQVKAQARDKARALLAAISKDRGSFAAVAKKESQDPGSASQGGELDWFSRGAMTKPFEDAAFGLKKGEISDVVASDFGFHIIEVLDIRGGTARSFESVRAELLEEVKQQLAQTRFAAVADQFTDAVDQEDGLKAVAERFKLPLLHAEKLTRSGDTAATGPLSNPKLLEALFQPDSLEKKRNLSAVEIGASQLASARVLSYSPARKLPLAEVKERVRQVVLERKAQAAARSEGEAKLAQWKSGSGQAQLPLELKISRASTHDQPRELVEGVLRAKADPTPVWVGVDLGTVGYAVAKIEKVEPADAVALGGGRARAQYAQAWAQAESDAYYAALRDRFKARVIKKE